MCQDLHILSRLMTRIVVRVTHMTTKLAISLKEDLTLSSYTTV